MLDQLEKGGNEIQFIQHLKSVNKQGRSKRKGKKEESKKGYSLWQGIGPNGRLLGDCVALLVKRFG